MTARLICPVRPYVSAFGKALDSRYTASTTSIPRCQTSKSRNWFTLGIQPTASPGPRPPAPGPSTGILTHIHQHPEHRQGAKQRAAAVADHGERDAFRG